MTEDAAADCRMDWARIEHLLKLGIAAALIVLAGDLLLGWGTAGPRVEGIPAFLSRYLTVSDERIFASALLGLFGIPLECLCWFAVYRLIQPYSPKEAHAYRAGILGCLAFGACGVHVPCCMAVYLLKHFYADNPATAAGEILRWMRWFLFPAAIVFLVFFLLAAAVQFRAFRSGHTPLPKQCCIFSVLSGLFFGVLFRLFGDHALTNGLSAGWISLGNLWMTGGLLIYCRKAHAVSEVLRNDENDIED